MRLGLWSAGLAAIVVAAGAPLHASTGGPQYAELLGWDAQDRKVFFSLVGMNESGLAPAVVYLKVDGSPSARAARVSWSREKSDGDAEYERRLRDLKRRLRPLPEIPGPTVFHTMEAVPTDTVPEWRLPRYRVRVYEPFSEDLLEVTTLVEPSVRMIRRYSIPGRTETIGVLSFRGIPHEAGYEVQIPILLSKPRETPRSGPRPVRRIDSVLP